MATLGLGRAAKRQMRLRELACRYEAEGEADVAMHYREMADTLVTKLRDAHACLRCGRILADFDADYGPECLQAVIEASGEYKGHDSQATDSRP